MILRKLRMFLPTDSISDYLYKENRQNLENIQLVLNNLTFDNFNGFIYEGSIAASTELAIPNQLRPVIPSNRIILRSDSVNIVDGQEWTADNVYIKNVGGTTANVKILFLP